MSLRHVKKFKYGEVMSTLKTCSTGSTGPALSLRKKAICVGEKSRGRVVLKRVNEKTPLPLIEVAFTSEPPQGFEPWTPALRKLCSTAELRRRLLIGQILESGGSRASRLNPIPNLLRQTSRPMLPQEVASYPINTTGQNC